jgi:putative transposase
MSGRAKANQELLLRIVRIHQQSHEIYGSPRVWAVLRRQGVVCGKNRVARVMRWAGLQGRVVKVTRRAPGVHRFYEKNANLRLHQPLPRAVNEQWVGDVTYLKVNGQACFMAVVMDVYSRKVVGWALGRDRTARLTRRALTHALEQHKPARGCIFHSDRGVEYGSADYSAVLKHHGFRASMNRAYHSQDNAHMESFFHSMKAEWIRGRSFQSFDDLESSLRVYIRFYNGYRLHSGIDYHTPMEYEKKAA